MVEKAKIFYFAVFILVVFACIFHVTAMGHHHWKKADLRDMNTRNPLGFNYTIIGLFTRCIISPTLKQETCFPNMLPGNNSCNPQTSCWTRESNPFCSCDFLPSTKGIAACAIIASIFLGLTIIILFIHSINASETRSLGMVLSLLPLILLLLAFIFILIALILVGSYLSRDVMHLLYEPGTVDRSNIKTGSSPAIHSEILLDEKYDAIRIEAINAGILLKETDEKIDELIHDARMIKSHGRDIRSNALRFYQNLIQSRKIIRFCQLIYILISIIIIIILIGKTFSGKRNL
ncbi:unnamed protein product [Rotaria magnacalcarata]|uniref:Uncharacterized protein n=1 Tax=Rotaria magnacalcarata TaxID=392030 RepID=A0A8S2MS64_9BILA|nr:unnamed protein product [Rotaria magnacalcarata]